MIAPVGTTQSPRVMTPPVHLGVPMPEPEPTPGCDVCAALAEQREGARERGDMSKVADRNIEIRNHAQGEGSGRQGHTGIGRVAARQHTSQARRFAMGGNGNGGGDSDERDEGIDDREYDRDQDFGRTTDPNDPNIADGDPRSR